MFNNILKCQSLFYSFHYWHKFTQKKSLIKRALTPINKSWQASHCFGKSAVKSLISTCKKATQNYHVYCCTVISPSCGHQLGIWAFTLYECPSDEGITSLFFISANLISPNPNLSTEFLYFPAFLLVSSVSMVTPDCIFSGTL